MFNIVQNPWLLLILSFISLSVIVIIRRENPDKCGWAFFLVPLLLAVGGFGIDEFFASDYEKIDSAVTVVARAVVDADADTIEEIISDDYQDSIHLSKPVLLVYCRVMLSRPLIEKAKKVYHEIAIDGSEATAKIEYMLHLDPRSSYAEYTPMMPIKMNLYFTKTEDDDWLISSAEILEIHKQPATWRTVK